jgi:hypothetical protein
MRRGVRSVFPQACSRERRSLGRGVSPSPGTHDGHAGLIAASVARLGHARCRSPGMDADVDARLDRARRDALSSVRTRCSAVASDSVLVGTRPSSAMTAAAARSCSSSLRAKMRPVANDRRVREPGPSTVPRGALADRGGSNSYLLPARLRSHACSGPGPAVVAPSRDASDADVAPVEIEGQREPERLVVVSDVDHGPIERQAEFCCEPNPVMSVQDATALIDDDRANDPELDQART